jgi:hypothetical protein
MQGRWENPCKTAQKGNLAQKVGGMLREIREMKKSCKTAQEGNLAALSVPTPRT